MTTVTCFSCCNIFVSILCDLLLTDKVKYSKLYYVKKKKQGVENMKNWSFLNKFVLIAGLVLASQGFAALDCATGTVWGEFTTQAASKAKDGYYEIDTPEKLAWVACKTTNGALQSDKFKLTQDIDLEGKLFIPIAAGKGDAKFKGILDGKGYTIKGLYIKGSEITKEEVNGAKVYAQNIGLVAILSGNGTIKNLVLEVSEIYASSSAGDDGMVGADNPISVGTLVGWMESGKIENCVVEGSITTSGNKNRVGGLAGNVWSATITDCVSNVFISASGDDTHVGGVVGALRKGKTVTLSSCVFDGDTLISTGGTVGGIVGYHEDATVNASNLYYTGDYEGTGKPKEGVTIPTSHKNDDELNSEEVVCALNKGTWDDVNKTCDEAKSDVWSEGQTGISMNGSDGYKVSFNANGGTFASGAKTFKIFAKGATITADEITEPTRTDKKFAGWATTDAAEKPTALGVADSNKTVYAVWYNIYTITFKISDSESHAISVPKNGHVSVEGFSVPTFILVPDPEDENHKIKYYFTGWNYEQKFLEGNDELTSSDTLHIAGIEVFKDTTLFPVWTKAETYSVTFDATLHGKTHVRFVKKVNDGDKVEKPDANDIVTNPGYAITGWRTEDGGKYDFDDQLKSNLTLYAEWDLEEYTISYEMNGGTNNGSNLSTYTVESDPITFAAPTYAGYTFEGWFYDADFTEPATGIATNSTTGDKTLYARWTRIVYTIEYLSGNDVSATIVADKKYWNESLTLKGEAFALVREGYVHKGWSTTENGPLAYDFGDTYDKNEGEILFPHWVKATSYGAVTVYTYENDDGRKEAVIDGNSEEETNIPEDIEVDAVTFDRTFPVGNRSTIVLPFDIAVANTHGGKFNVLSSISGDFKTITLGEKSSQLYAYEPYVMLADQSTLTFDGPVTLKKTVDGEKQIGTSDWYFVPAYEKIVFGERDDLLGRAYGFAGKAVDKITVGQFVKVGSRAYVNPMRAYLVYRGELNGSSATKSAVGSGFGTVLPDEINVVVQDEQGNIVERGVLDTKTGEFRMDRWYDLQGRKLNGEPQTQGTYYHNGKRVIVK